METKPIQEMSELELYFVIDGCGAFIWRMNHDMADDRIEQEHHAAIDEDITRMRATQKEAIQELPRVGIAQPLDEQGAGTPEYWTWYRTWSAWHKDKLSNDEWNDLNKRLSRGLTAEELEECKKRAFDLPLPENYGDKLFQRKNSDFLLEVDAMLQLLHPEHGSYPNFNLSSPQVQLASVSSFAPHPTKSNKSKLIRFIRTINIFFAKFARYVIKKSLFRP